MTDFRSSVLAAFSYLETEFGFSLVSERNDRLAFASASTRVAVFKERQQIFVDIGPLVICEDLDLGEILLYKVPMLNFKYSDPSITDMVTEMGRLATLVRQHCTDMLKGDFGEMPGVLLLRQRRYNQLLGPDRS